MDLSRQQCSSDFVGALGLHVGQHCVCCGLDSCYRYCFSFGSLGLDRIRPSAGGFVSRNIRLGNASRITHPVSGEPPTARSRSL